jgi:hypothetical protein
VTFSGLNAAVPPGAHKKLNSYARLQHDARDVASEMSSGYRIEKSSVESVVCAAEYFAVERALRENKLGDLDLVAILIGTRSRRRAALLQLETVLAEVAHGELATGIGHLRRCGPNLLFSFSIFFLTAYKFGCGFADAGRVH